MSNEKKREKQEEKELKFPKTFSWNNKLQSKLEDICKEVDNEGNESDGIRRAVDYYHQSFQEVKKDITILPT